MGADMITTRHSRRPRAGPQRCARSRPPSRTASSRTPGPPSLPVRRAEPGSRHGRPRASCPSSCARATSTIGCMASWPRQPTAQVVLLGAGLDTRALPPPLAGDATLSSSSTGRPSWRTRSACSREPARGPAARRRVVVATSADGLAAAARRAGFDSQRPATWLLEGLLFYLPGEQLVRVLEQVTGSRSAWQPPRLRHRQRRRPDLAVHAALGRDAGRGRCSLAGHDGGPGRLPGPSAAGTPP